MRYWYLDDFGRGISVFAIFSYGIAVLGTPQCPPQKTTQLLLIEQICLKGLLISRLEGNTRPC